MMTEKNPLQTYLFNLMQYNSQYIFKEALTNNVNVTKHVNLVTSAVIN